MNFKLFLEVYSRENSWLKQYLKNKDLDLANHYYEFMNWIGASKVLQRLGISKEQLKQDSEEGTGDVLSKIEKSLSPQEIEDLVSSMEDTEAPTWKFMDYSKQIPRDTWLVHFSNNAQDISYKGFTHGIDDPTKLAYTTSFSQNAKKYGGYNFAFIADSRYAINAARTQKYGKNAVMFQSSGIAAYHYGDEEEQIVFWGKAIAPGSMVYLEKGDDWCVRSERGKRDCLYHGEYLDAVNWVEHNYQQYRKSLFSLPPKGWHKQYSSG